MNKDYIKSKAFKDLHGRYYRAKQELDKIGGISCCTSCGKYKALEDFPSGRVKAGSTKMQCKECMKPIAKKWREENREYIKLYRATRDTK